MVYVCDLCGYEYDESRGDSELGIEPGAKWENLPDGFTCPLCGAGKEAFSPQE